MKDVKTVKIYIYTFVLLISISACSSEMVQPINLDNVDVKFTVPHETSNHEGTWLQWPHNYTYGSNFREDLELTWVEMVKALIKGENVHIIAYNQEEKEHIIDLLEKENISLLNIDFVIHETDDFWIRDNGPMFVFDRYGNQVILDWGFNGWGNKTPYEKCDRIPRLVGEEIGVESIDLNDIVLEGGAIEIDGNGTFMATRSSVTNLNRNPDYTEKEIESKLKKYLGVSNFIWLDGVYNSDDITDYHIDGFAKFHNSETIITMQKSDLMEWGVKDKDIRILYNATGKNGLSYNYIYLPLTQNNVITEWGKNLQYKGSYLNYYVANKVVLVPNYNDVNDKIANDILQELYPNREIIGIDVRNLYYYGGMIHCVTQQQPEIR